MKLYSGFIEFYDNQRKKRLASTSAYESYSDAEYNVQRYAVKLRETFTIIDIYIS